jgi:hypothetical protein
MLLLGKFSRTERRVELLRSLAVVNSLSVNLVVSADLELDKPEFSYLTKVSNGVVLN